MLKLSLITLMKILFVFIISSLFLQDPLQDSAGISGPHMTRLGVRAFSILSWRSSDLHVDVILQIFLNIEIQKNFKESIWGQETALETSVWAAEQ